MNNDNKSDEQDPETTVDQGAKYFIVMDSYGGDWTPAAVFPDADEAIKAREMLAADADSVCVTAPYYASKEAVRDEGPSDAPDGLQEVHIAFSNDEALAISDDDWAAREVQCIQGGLRGTEQVFETADEFAIERPSAIGQFITSEMTADDILETIQ